MVMVAHWNSARFLVQFYNNGSRLLSGRTCMHYCRLRCRCSGKSFVNVNLGLALSRCNR